MRISWLGPFAVAAILLTSTGIDTQAVLTVWKTGVGSNGEVLNPGSVDPHWTFQPAYHAAGPGESGSLIVGLSQDGGTTYGVWATDWLPDSAPLDTYLISTTFDLTGYNPGTAKLQFGYWGGEYADASYGWYLNGTPVWNGAFAAGNGYATITSGFVSGVNTLSYNTYWRGGVSLETYTPSALTVWNPNPILTATPIPEPTTMIAGALLLLPFGLQGVRMLRNRRQAA